MDINLNVNGTLNVTFPQWPEIKTLLQGLDAKLDLILQKEDYLMSASDDLATAVAAEDTTIASAVALLNGIPALITASATAAGVDAATIAKINADIVAQTATLAAAVVVGTPVPPTSPTAPVITPPVATSMAQKAVADAKRK
jgi:hypothetical protein